MSRSKYKMTDAAAKRITAALYAKWEPGHYLGIEHVEQALRDEDFWGAHKANYINDLVSWMIENNHENFSRMITERFVRQYYEQCDGIDDLESGLRKLGIIPYPKDDS